MIETPHFWPNLTGKIHPQAELAVKMLFNAQQEQDQAVVALKAQLEKAVVAQTVVNNTPTVTPTAPTSDTSNLGNVNNQTGVTYTIQDSDYGGIVTFSNASPTIVTLNPAVRQNWFGALECLAGGVLIMPSGATINGAANLQLTVKMGALLFFDGTNWWAMTVPLQPRTLAAAATKFFTSYNATTGVFTSAQPVESDILNLVPDLAAKAPTANPTFSGVVTQPDAPVMTAATTTTSATAGAATALPATPAGYLTVSINGASVKIPYFSV